MGEGSRIEQETPAKATRIRGYQAGHQSERLLEARVSCLDDQLRSVEALIDALPTLSVADRTENALLAVAKLEDPLRCMGVTGNDQRHLSKAQAVVEKRLRSQLAKSVTLDNLGQSKPASELLAQVAENASEDVYAHVKGKALLRQARKKQNVGEEGAEELLHYALALAFRVGDEAMIATGWAFVAYEAAKGGSQDQSRLATMWAEALLPRIKDPNRRLAVHNGLGLAARALGNLETAEGHYTIALESARGLARANVLNNLARIHNQRGDGTAARSLVEIAIEIFSEELAPSHPTVAKAHLTLGISYFHDGQFKEALAAITRGLVIVEAHYGTQHMTTIEFRHQRVGALR